MKYVTGTSKQAERKRRHARIRARVAGTAARPRLAVFKSNRFISAQVIDDMLGRTLVSAHGREAKGPQSVRAKVVGETIAKAARAKGIDAVVFDRGGYRYAGQVKTLAEAARAGGLVF